MKACVMKTIRKQTGATLLEALAFLGIAAIVVVGAIAMFRAAQGSAQSGDMLKQINGFRSGMKGMYGSQAQYGAATWSPSVATQALNASVINGKVVPDTLRASGANIFNAFNGQVRVDGDGATFWVRYDAVPQEVCVKTASNTDSSWMGISINGTYTDLSTVSGSLPVATAVAQCPAGSGFMIWRGR